MEVQQSSMLRTQPGEAAVYRATQQPCCTAVADKSSSSTGVQQLLLLWVYLLRECDR